MTKRCISLSLVCLVQALVRAKSDTRLSEGSPVRKLVGLCRKIARKDFNDKVHLFILITT